MPNINFSDKQESCNLTYVGRNGTGKCAGLEILHLDYVGRIQLSPLNSKGNIANCSIDIPDDPAVVKEICDHLSAAVKQPNQASSAERN